MEFNQKLQQLRKEKKMTQQELADALFVSRTAISKWESGRGYPSIDSLRQIARIFSVTVDTLLSADELLYAAEEDNKQKQGYFRDLVFGLLDLCSTLLLFLPFFAMRTDGEVTGASLLSLSGNASNLKWAFVAITAMIILCGITTLAFQNCDKTFWLKNKTKISIIPNLLGVLLFTLCLQPYAAVFLFVFLTAKALMLIKKQ